jgi:hypothetical protein
MKQAFMLLLCLVALCSQAQVLPKIKPTLPAVKNKVEEMFNSYQARPNKDEVWFFENAGYGGKKYILTRGQYTLKELGMDANDFFSSAIIPAHLMVVVFEDDNIGGSYYALESDARKKYNTDFTKVEIFKGKDVDGRTLAGTKDLNDKISSIIVFDMLEDVVTLYEDCSYKGESLTLTPCPISKTDQVKCFAATPGSKKWGWLNMADLGFDDKISSVKIKGEIGEVRIFTGKDLEVSAENSKGNFLKYSSICLKNKQYTTENAIYPGNSDWNDRISSLTITMKPGSVTIVN